MRAANLTVVVCCNKNDFFFARICIASIRYYYPDIDIEMVKDNGNGAFNTLALQKYFKVKIVDIGISKLGWSAAKFQYLYRMPKGKKVLLMDSDIVFAGPFLERMETLFSTNDYVVNLEFQTDPYALWVKEIYFDVKTIENLYPDYTYPGYFFNAGQIFVTVGAIDEHELDKYFDRHHFPFWTNTAIFPLVDQSVYNYLLPSLAQKKKLKLATASYMLWSKSDMVKNLDIKKIADKSFDAGLIHWAGDSRTPYLNKMTRSDILIFFEDYYYQRIPWGFFEQGIGKLKSFVHFIFKRLYYQSKKIFFNTFKYNVG